MTWCHRAYFGRPQALTLVMLEDIRAALCYPGLWIAATGLVVIQSAGFELFPDDLRSARMPVYRLVVTIVCTLGIVLTSSPHAAADLWEQRGSDCDDTAFKRPLETGLKKIARCVRLFEAYNNARFEGSDDSAKRKVITAMKRLYAKGSAMDANIARIGLARLGVSVPPKPADGQAIRKTTKRARPARVRFSGCPGGTEPTAPDKKAIKKAKKAFKKGMKKYKKDDFEGALGQFEKMLELAPGYHSSIYNVSTMSAKTGNTKRAINLLWCLRDMGTEDSLRKVRDARKDSDFEDLRRNDAFKIVTGYARILILDSLPEGRGDDNVTNLKDRIEKLKYEVIAVKPDNVEKTAPHIWYRHTNRIQAFIFSRIISHPHTKLIAMPAALEKRGYDVVISWGDRYKKGEDPPLRINEVGDDIDKELKDIEKQEDAIFSKPDEFDKEVDDALGEGDKATDTVDDAADKIDDLSKKPGETVDKATKTIDKVTNPF